MEGNENRAVLRGYVSRMDVTKLSLSVVIVINMDSSVNVSMVSVIDQHYR